MTSYTGSVEWGFCGFEKSKLLSWVLASEENGWLSGLAQIRPVVCSGVSRVVGGIWKSQHRKIFHHSPYVEKPFNSMVVKSFVPEQRSRKCFCVSGFLCALWTFYVYFTYSCMAMLHFFVLFNVVLGQFFLVHPRKYQCCWVLFLLLFLIYSLSTLSLLCKVLFIIINFLVFWYICWSSFFILHERHCPGVNLFDEISAAEL